APVVTRASRARSSTDVAAKPARPNRARPAATSAARVCATCSARRDGGGAAGPGGGSAGEVAGGTPLVYPVLTPLCMFIILDNVAMSVNDPTSRGNVMEDHVTAADTETAHHTIASGPATPVLAALPAAAERTAQLMREITNPSAPVPGLP